MRQTILVVAALMLVLSAAAFAVAPVHAAGTSNCPGVADQAASGSNFGSTVGGNALLSGTGYSGSTTPYNPLSCILFDPHPF